MGDIAMRTAMLPIKAPLAAVCCTTFWDTTPVDPAEAQDRRAAHPACLHRAAGLGMLSGKERGQQG